MLKQYFLLSSLILFYCVTFCISFQTPSHAQNLKANAQKDALISDNLKQHSDSKKPGGHDSVNHSTIPAYETAETQSSAALIGLDL